jgi:hypothetical protein
VFEDGFLGMGSIDQTSGVPFEVRTRRRSSSFLDPLGPGEGQHHTVDQDERLVITSRCTPQRFALQPRVRSFSADPAFRDFMN